MVIGVATERITIKLPDGFDPARHSKSLEKMIADKYGSGFEIDSIDPAAGTAFATRQAAITEISSTDEQESFEVRLVKGTKPADGERVAIKMADQYDGYQMVRFDPFLGKAVLAKMDPATIRCRGAVAVALGAKPWEVGVTPRPDGGFDLDLPNRYVPSKHDDKLDEVATEVVGKAGWYVDIDPAGLSASINPGEPPTFPVVIPYPFAKPPRFDPTSTDWARLPLGRILGRTGGEDGPELETDFVANPHGMVNGLTGSGKGVSAMALISGALARGWELAIVDAIKGGVDFVEFEQFVRPGGWGDELRTACCVLNMAYAEGVRRKKLIKDRSVLKWTQLPTSDNLRPLMVVVDELTSLIAPEPTPKGVAKDNPLVLEVAERNLLKATILSTIGKIAREQRFTGLALVIATQVASTSTGIPTELRANLGAKILLGSKPTDNNRRLALNDADAVPKIPLNIVNDAGGAFRGVGVFEFDGTEPGVFKSYFASPADYAAWLEKLGVPTTTAARPSAADIARHTPSLDDSAGPVTSSNSGQNSGTAGDRSPSGRLRPEAIRDPETGDVLHGYERANEARRQLNAAADGRVDR
jgi:hypothetical protein